MEGTTGQEAEGEMEKAWQQPLGGLGFSLTEEIRTLLDLTQPWHQRKPVIKPVRPTAHVIIIQGGMVKRAGIKSAEDRALQEERYGGQSAPLYFPMQTSPAR